MHGPYRVPRRRFELGQTLARLLCLAFGLLGLLPFLVGLVLTSPPVERWAALETARILEQQLGVQASYGVQLRLLPLRVEIHDLKVPASDGGIPAILADRITVSPRIFSLI